MQSKTLHPAFNLQTNLWEISWPERVSRHDVVYLSPPTDPMQGMPVGNGDVGVLCWCEDTKIILAVNKCDLWDDAPFERFHNWRANEEERNATLRHACRIVIDFKMPVFDTFYLSDFQGRISLADASIHIAASGPFGSVAFRGFVSHDDGVFCCEIEKDLIESSPTEIIMERYGSRTFAHWYKLVNRDSSIGVGGTDAGFDDGGIYITHQLTSGKFAAVCQLTETDGLELSTSRLNSHSSKIITAGEAQGKLSFVSAVSSPCSDDPMQPMKGKLASACERGMHGLFDDHKSAWKAFWMRSLMEFGDDYLDNLWHLTMYYANSSQRGIYPGRFINGLWGWNRDFQPWNFYFHWNQQEVYWPLNAAGHHELANSYLAYRFDSLPHAMNDAREILGADGAVVSDVCDRSGHNSAEEFANHTPVAEIALDFWRQYQFTGDRKFLEARALPYILAAARFFESLFEKDEYGAYHAVEGTGYEGWVKLRDPITELVYASVLFKVAIDALNEAGIDDSHAAKWQEILDSLAPLPTFDLVGIYIEKGTFKLTSGLFKGQQSPDTEVFAAGFGIAENRMLASRVLDGQAHDDWTNYEGIFPVAEYSTVFPSGLIGLSGNGTKSFKTAVSTAKLYAPDCMGWDPLPIVLARLGLSVELQTVLNRWPGRWQCYCNGFGHYDPRGVKRVDAHSTYVVEDAAYSNIKDARIDDDGNTPTFLFPTRPFRHMGMESMSVLACAMNEALLQSHDGTIRVAPAVTDTQIARFTLHARGGFIVSSEITDGKPLWIAIESVLGNNCKLQIPWPTAYVFENGKLVDRHSNGTIEFQTGKGRIFTLVPNSDAIESWDVCTIECQPSVSPKVSPSGDASLGLPRMF